MKKILEKACAMDKVDDVKQGAAFAEWKRDEKKNKRFKKMFKDHGTRDPVHTTEQQ